MPEMLLSCVPHVWRILQGVLNVGSSLHFAQSAAAAQEIAEAPPVADEARRFRGSVPIGGHEVAGNRLTRRCSGKTIQSSGTVLPKPHLSTGKGSPETIRFLMRFWLLFLRGKSNPAETGQADSISISTINPPPHKEKPAGVTGRFFR